MINRENRKIIAQETLKILDKGTYKSTNGMEVNITSEINYATENTKLYDTKTLDKLPRTTDDTSFETKIEVVHEDVVSCIHRVSKLSKHVMCLNFASAKNAGGGFINGAIAQEEALAIASNLYKTQIETDGFYNLHRSMKSCVYTDTMIYSPNVVFFRDTNLDLVENPSKCTIITSAAVNAGIVLQREKISGNKITDLMHKRIEKVLALAKYKKNDTLILGAWGCGVFRNDPLEIAKLFKKLLDNEYKNQFKHIVFAVFSRNTKFINAFKEVFKIYENEIHN